MRTRSSFLTRSVNRLFRTALVERVGLWGHAPARTRHDEIVALTTARAGAAAVGALAFGAVALGALAIRRLFVGRARVGSVVIDKLVVNKLTVHGNGAVLSPIGPIGQGVVSDDASSPSNRAANGDALHPVADLKQGDEAAPGTIGTGEQACPVCGGSGLIDSQRCENCAGTGTITHAIGGGR